MAISHKAAERFIWSLSFLVGAHEETTASNDPLDVEKRVRLSVSSVCKTLGIKDLSGFDDIEDVKGSLRSYQHLTDDQLYDAMIDMFLVEDIEKGDGYESYKDMLDELQGKLPQNAYENLKKDAQVNQEWIREKSRKRLNHEYLSALCRFINESIYFNREIKYSPKETLEILINLINKLDAHLDICFVAAGPLESLWAKSAEEIFDDLDVAVRKYPKMRVAIQSIWCHGDPRLMKLLKKILGKYGLEYGSS